MTTLADSHSFIRKCFFLALLVVVNAAPQAPCDRESCPGPLRYYKDLGCTPVYDNPGDCCASRYDCSHLKNLSKDKCYVNGREYNVGENLKDEDRNPCDIGCTCRKDSNDIASFVCAALDCGILPPGPNCFHDNSYNDCCPGSMVCLKEGEERATCEVDGEVYKHGEYFKPKSNPEKECYCKPGYTGENVEPFCKKPNRDNCSPLFRNAGDVHQNCVPVFYVDQNPQKDCSYASRCQNNKDNVIHKESTKAADADENEICRFGNMTMHKNDELNQGTFYDSVCVKCVCDVPPIPTCQRLPDSECDVSKHEPFEDDGFLHGFR